MLTMLPLLTFALLQASFVASQATTMQIILIDIGADYAGSVIGNAKGVATLSLDCVAGGYVCDADQGLTVTQGPSTYHFGFSTNLMPDNTLSRDIDCKLEPGQEMVTCKDTIFTVFDSRSYTVPDIITAPYSRAVKDVPITAGADKLKATEAAATTNMAQPKETGHSQTGQDTSKDATSMENAGPMVTANVVLAAAAVAGVLAL